MTSVREWINDNVEDTLLLTEEEYDLAIIGISQEQRVIYSVEKIIEIIMVWQNISYEEAYEHFEFNIEGAHMGAFTPIFCHTIGDE